MSEASEEEISPESGQIEMVDCEKTMEVFNNEMIIITTETDDVGENRKISENGTQKMITFKVTHDRNIYDINAPISQLVSDLQKHVHDLTQVLPTVQKLICKGVKLKPNKTLDECKLTDGSKVLLIGSTMEQIASASSKPLSEEFRKSQTASASKEPLSKQKIHQKIIDQGVPDDAMPGIRNVNDQLPLTPIKGLRNKSGRTVRLTFKLELDQLWIGTPERTDKIPMSSIGDIVFESIVGKEEYSIMGLSVGSTEASRLWLYWVPSQYVDAIKRSLLD